MKGGSTFSLGKLTTALELLQSPFRHFQAKINHFLINKKHFTVGAIQSLEIPTNKFIKINS